MTYLVVRTILGLVRFKLFDLSKPMKIEHLVTINGAILLVYYIGDCVASRRHRCYQYEILFWDGSIYQAQEAYESADKALSVGIDSVKTTIGY